VGRDARGRAQYRYHPEWRAFRDRVKFDRLLLFGESLPGIRSRIAADLSQPGVPREKVLATIVELLQTTLIRVGNERYARENGAYGLTTFRNKHAKVNGNEIHFVFNGKSGLRHEIRARHARVAKVLRTCQEIPGQRLFQYVDDTGNIEPVYSHDVNGYLRDAAAADVTAKDFRTWVATVSAAAALAEIEPPTSATEERTLANEVIATVANELGNTPAVCRASYIHPKVLTDFGSGALHEDWRSPPRRRAGLTISERRTLVVLGGRKRKRRPRQAEAA
jgi:DNA topoisomerase-1